LNWGPAANDTNFTSYNQGGGNVNVTLGFKFPYQNSFYNNVLVGVNGFIQLNNTIFIGAYCNVFCTNGSGSAVFYRQINWSSPDLTILTNKVLSTYSNYSQFVGYSAFVVTWYNVQSVTNPSQLNTFQLILVTDNVVSFILFYYVRLDSASQVTCMSFNMMNSTNITTINTSLNCTQGGSWVQNVNSGGI
jgi:hypothetical protein